MKKYCTDNHLPRDLTYSPKEDLSLVADRVKTLLDAISVSQDEAADAACISVDVVHNIIKGRPVWDSNLFALCHALGLSMYELMNPDDSAFDHAVREAKQRIEARPKQ